MTAAVVALSLALAAALGTLAFLAIRYARVVPDLVNASKDTIEARRLADEYRSERDDALIRLREATEREAAAIVRLKLTESRANKAAEEAARAVVERIKTAPTAAHAARALDELLTEPILPARREAGDPGADGSGA